jgi:hypothetical protein|tara:strand:- start:77 stop:307 length:231 start_codon:yes stop_codon:yes gene_type:complete
MQLTIGLRLGRLNQVKLQIECINPSHLVKLTGARNSTHFEQCSGTDVGHEQTFDCNFHVEDILTDAAETTEHNTAY